MMPFDSFLVLAAIAVLVTPVVVLILPRARRSTAFDRLLWGATALVAFLGAWMGVGMALNALEPGPFVIAAVPVLPAAVGAFVGALVVNLPLRLLDRFDRPSDPYRDEEWEELDEQDEELKERDATAVDENLPETRNGDSDIKRQA